MDTRDELLRCSDDDLLKRCQCQTFRGSGPGGQHRNTSDSSVRLTLPDHGVTVTCGEQRSQLRNRRIALRKLRLAIAIQRRCDPPLPWQEAWQTGRKSQDYPWVIAAMLDALAANGWAIGAAARALSLSTGKLARLLAADPTLWTHVNQQRERLGLRPLSK